MLKLLTLCFTLGLASCTALDNNPRLKYALGSALGTFQQQQAQQEAFRQQQMLINSQKRSTTNCYMIGNQMTCNTY